MLNHKNKNLSRNYNKFYDLLPEKENISIKCKKNKLMVKLYYKLPLKIKFGFSLYLITNTDKDNTKLSLN